MSNENTSMVEYNDRKEFVHYEFPNLTNEQLRKNSKKFSIDSNLLSLLFSEPFYADIVRSLHKVADEQFPTIGVYIDDETLNMIWNPLFVSAYDNLQVRGLLKHEALHIALGHCTIRKYNPHWVWNIAADLAINATIPDEELPRCGFKPGRKLMKPDESVWNKMTKKSQDNHIALSKIVEKLPSDLSSEEYFSILMSNDSFDKSADNCVAGVSMDDHEGWSEGLSDEQKNLVQAKIQQIVREAQQRADSKNSWGSVSAAMREKIRVFANGEIRWQDILKKFCGNTYRADRIASIFRVNRKYPGIHSGHSRDYKPRLYCYVDQSGSMSDEAIALCFTELASLSRQLEITIFHFDTEVDESSRVVWTRGKSFPTVLRTRCGGTDFNAATAHAEREKPDGYIILTDGEAPKPASTRIRRCWVVIPNHKLTFENDSRDVVVKMKKNFKI